MRPVKFSSRAFILVQPLPFLTFMRMAVSSAPILEWAKVKKETTRGAWETDLFALACRSLVLILFGDASSGAALVLSSPVPMRVGDATAVRPHDLSMRSSHFELKD